MFEGIFEGKSNLNKIRDWLLPLLNPQKLGEQIVKGIEMKVFSSMYNNFLFDGVYWR